MDVMGFQDKVIASLFGDIVGPIENIIKRRSGSVFLRFGDKPWGQFSYFNLFSNDKPWGQFSFFNLLLGEPLGSGVEFVNT